MRLPCPGPIPWPDAQLPGAAAQTATQGRARNGMARAAWRGSGSEYYQPSARRHLTWFFCYNFFVFVLKKKLRFARFFFVKKNLFLETFFHAAPPQPIEARVGAF